MTLKKASTLRTGDQHGVGPKTGTGHAHAAAVTQTLNGVVSTKLGGRGLGGLFGRSRPSG
jgi:hypothetical protein